MLSAPETDIASYSRISSARERSEGGTVRPSALAVFEVDHQHEFGRALHWKVGGPFALKDAID